HSLRRTFASLLYAIGEPAPVVMQELGHTHPGLALRICAAAMRRDDDENGRLRILIEGGSGTKCPFGRGRSVHRRWTLARGVPLLGRICGSWAVPGSNGRPP